MQRAVDAGLDLADPDLLGLAVGVGAVGGVIRALKGEIPVEHLPAWMVVDSVLRGTLVLAAGKFGAGLGLIVIGPAGALMLGPALGAASVLGVGMLRSEVDRRINREWHDKLRSNAAALHEQLVCSLKKRIDLQLDRHRILSNKTPLALPEDLYLWIRRRAGDDFLYAAETLEELGPAPTGIREIVELELIAARHAPADPDVLSARKRIRDVLANPPAPLDGVLDRVAGAMASPRQPM